MEETEVKPLIDSPEVFMQIIENSACCMCGVSRNTGKLIFMNQKMRQQFDISRNLLDQPLCHIPVNERSHFLLSDLLRQSEGSSHTYYVMDREKNVYYEICAQLIEMHPGEHMILYNITDSTYTLLSQRRISRQAAGSELIAQISNWFNESSDFDHTVTYALQRAGEFLHADWAIVAEYTDRGRRMNICHEWQRNHRCSSATSFAIPAVLYATAGRAKGRAITVEDVLDTQEFRIYANDHIRAFMNVPLFIRGRLWGVLEFNQQTPRQWDSQDCKFAVQLSKILSVLLTDRLLQPELDQANQIIHTIIDMMPVAVFWKDTNSCYIGCNEKYEHFIGIPREQFIGTNGENILPKNHLEHNMYYDQYILTPGSTGRVSYEMTLRNSEGTQHFVHVTKSVVRDEKGLPKYIIGVYQTVPMPESVTTHSDFPSTLKSNMDITQSHIFYITPDSDFIRAFSNEFSFAGYSLEEIDQKSAADFLPPHAQLQLKKALKESIRTGREISGLEYALEGKGGRHYYYSINIFPIFDENKIFQHFRAAYTDITLLKNSERKLKQMLAIVEHLPFYAAVIGRRGAYQYVNPAAEQITGYSQEELMEKGLSTLFDQKTMKQILNEIIPEVQQKKKMQMDMTCRCKNGDTRILDFTVFITDENIKEVAALGIDATEKRKLDQELLEAKIQAEQASRAKSEFLSRMSHEIRTPLNAIIGMSCIARDTEDSAKKAYCMDKVDTASKQLLNIVNDILDMSRIEADRFELKSQEFNLEQMLMNAANMIQVRADEKQQDLIINLDRNIPSCIIGDELRLSQVITNLLSNAVKFTQDQGTILLNISMTEITRDSDACTLLFQVIDNGIGIAKEDQKRLFNAFEQVDGGSARKYGGTGLGLTISRRIVEMMGGEIWVDSQPDQGSTFSFTIQCRRGHSGRPLLLDPQIDPNQIRILVVDDSPLILQYFTQLMDALHLPCDTADNGLDALAKIMKAGAHQPYTIIFLDWQMPHMDGITLAERIRRLSKQTYMIMISTADNEELIQKALAAGIQKFVPKPIFPSLLIDAIHEVLKGPAIQYQPQQQKPGPRNLRGHTILLAEDIDINREIILTMLEKEGVQIDCAVNGVEAFHMYRDNPNQYSLIFMDIHMPEMDGLESTRRIRALEKSRNLGHRIPIIAMTANVFKEDIENCVAAGMDDHIGKPINMEELFKMLEKFLSFGKKNQNDGKTPAEDPQSAEPAPQPQQTPQPESHNTPAAAEKPPMEDGLVVIDKAGGLARMMNNEALYHRLLSSFQGRQMTDALKENIDAGNLTAAAQSAHALKGLSANLGLLELSRLCSQIEQMAKNDHPVDHYVQGLYEALDRVEQAIQEILS